MPTATHARETLRLAAPVALSRVGILLIVAADVAMTGRYSSEELAFLALASGPFMPLLLFGIGALMGVLTRTAEACGAGRIEASGAVWRAGVVFAVVIGAALALASLGGEWLFRATGQSEALSAGAGEALVAFGIGIPGALVFAASTYYLEALRRPLPGLVVMALANVLNIALNAWLIGGGAGVPELGATGAALATSIVRTLSALALVLYVLKALDAQTYGTRRGPSRGLFGNLARLGLPIGLAQSIESGAFATMTLFAGMLGVLQLAAYQIAFNLTALLFMVALGISTAANVRVGHLLGHGAPREAARAGWIAAGLTAAVLALLGVGVALAATPLSQLYSTDPAVIAITVPTLFVVAFAIVPDGTQTTLMGALRGASDVWPASLRFLVSFWGVMLPYGYWFGVVKGGGAPALVEGVFFGALVCCLLLGVQFRHVIARRALDIESARALA